MQNYQSNDSVNTISMYCLFDCFFRLVDVGEPVTLRCKPLLMKLAVSVRINEESKGTRLLINRRAAIISI